MADQRAPSAPRRRVVVRDVGHQRARDPRAGARGTAGAATSEAGHASTRARSCCSRCRPPRPRSCASRRAASPTGSRAASRQTGPCCPTWPTRWRAGVRTGRCARPCSRASFAELAPRCATSPTATRPYQAAVGQDDRGPVWVFSGQGSQWAGMGAALLATEPVFAATIAEIEPLIARESGFSVTEAMSAAETVTGIDRVQPTAVRHAGRAGRHDEVLRRAPGAVIGHSLGEAAAAVVAGALSLEDGVKVICRRSRLMTRIAGSGAMASVELPAPASAFGARRLAVSTTSCSPWSPPRQSTVVGGATETVRELVAAWEQQRRDGARGRRRRRVALARRSTRSSTSCPRCWRTSSRWSRRSRTTRRPCATRATGRRSTPTTGRTTCATRCASPRRCRPRWRTATGCSASSRRIRC